MARDLPATAGADIVTPAISLLISDVDGTLLDPAGRLTEGTIAAVKALDAAGIIFALASGRPPLGMSMLVAPLAVRTPMAGFNGAVFTQPSMLPLKSHLLPRDIAWQTIGEIRRHGLDTWVHTPTQWFVQSASGPHVAHETDITQLTPIVTETFDSALAQVAKIVGVGDDPVQMLRCERALEALNGSGASISRSQPYFLDVTHPDANKGVVVAQMSEWLSIPRSRIATIGDMPNDVLMFHQSALSIAMGNASGAVKSEASQTTTANTDNGFAFAVHTFVLGGGTNGSFAR